ncbi:MAG TPA: hypothetical protein VFN67_36360 [Polyangiales bacterium]|nr:hypothetical protein [Polyangiales bacterium]
MRGAGGARQRAAGSCESLAFAGALLLLGGCGYSETDMQLQRDRVELQRRLLDACEAEVRACAARAACKQR